MKKVVVKKVNKSNKPSKELKKALKESKKIIKKVKSIVENIKPRDILLEPMVSTIGTIVIAKYDIIIIIIIANFCHLTFSKMLSLFSLQFIIISNISLA